MSIMLPDPCTPVTTPRRRFLDDLDVPEARARILIALSVLGHTDQTPGVQRAIAALRGEL